MVTGDKQLPETSEIAVNVEREPSVWLRVVLEKVGTISHFFINSADNNVVFSVQTPPKADVSKETDAKGPVSTLDDIKRL